MHFCGFVYIRKNRLKIAFRQLQITLVIQIAPVQQFVQLVLWTTVLFMKISLEALGNPFMHLPILKEVAFFAKSLQYRLKQQEYMSFLRACQQGDCFSERRLILIGKWLAILHRKIGAQVLIQSGMALLDTFLPELALKHFNYLLLITTCRYLFSWAGWSLLLGELSGSQELLDLGGRTSDGEVRCLLCCGYQFRVQLRILVLQLSYAFLQLPRVLPFDSHLSTQSGNHLIFF